jgi:hypothetical protein
MGSVSYWLIVPTPRKEDFWLSWDENVMDYKTKAWVCSKESLQI